MRSLASSDDKGKLGMTRASSDDKRKLGMTLCSG